MAEKSDGNTSENRDIFSLNEFCECFDLPKWVEVVGGSDIGSLKKSACNIQKGMILLLRTLAVDNVTLSFNDAEVGKKIVQVSPNTQVKFNILLPYPDFKRPDKPRTVYKTVEDLLKVCPTYFKANIFYDDPYLPAIVKSGEVFRFVRQIRRPSDRRVYLQCKDADGNVIELPAECRGDFTAEEDENSYTLKEILDLGQVDRKLQLSKDHVSLSLVSDMADGDGAMYSNMGGSSSGDVLQRIMGLPLTYTGLLTFHSPNMFLAASPSEFQQDVWKVPLSLDIKVKTFVTDDYEMPVSGCEIEDVSGQPPPFKVYTLSELLDTYHEDFPVLARLVHYKDMPVEFNHSLEPGCELIIHKIERHDRLLAQSKDSYFTLDRKMNGRFRKVLRKFYAIKDLKDAFSEQLNEDLFVKVMQDVASDSPIQYSLQMGDVLKFKTLETKMHKVKLKSKSYGSFAVINCEKRTENWSFEKMMIPADLEIAIHELPSASKVEGFSIDEVFRHRPELPIKVDFLADFNTMWTCLPISSEITVTNFVTEAVALISPLQNFEPDEERRHIDNRVRDCLLVPARHQMMLTVQQCLGFPPNYFMFPDKSVFIGCPLEKISKDSFEELIRHNDMAYEDYVAGSPNSTGSDVVLPQRKSQSDETINKRLSRSFGNMMRQGPPRFFSRLKDKVKVKADKPTGAAATANAVDNLVYQAGSIHSDDPSLYDGFKMGLC
ncbi:hypothetical protein MAR_038318 [Mya arenaria]|uniref:CABIT domain-containing protein n=1 Tax=Mya arenaria TaxID=6604 RepID=A0ABY7FUU8_MYAAR|nr:hypothetical protein MAR_038318 [Mya arenaria]